MFQIGSVPKLFPPVPGGLQVQGIEILIGLLIFLIAGISVGLARWSGD